jgi:pimeloyl-ACP methyl ester carboxylesterase
MPSVNVNGVELYYETHGNGASILGIHGTPSSALMWEDAARQLAALGACTIYDRRGFGRSERPEPFESVDLDTHVADAVALLDALSATRAVVIGRSTGGQIALALAHMHPDRVAALALLEPAVLSADPRAEEWGRGLRRKILDATADNPAYAAEFVLREALGDDVWESLPEELQSMLSDAAPAVLAEIRGEGLDLSAHPFTPSDQELARIEQPVLLVSAEDSPEALRQVNDRLAGALPRAEQVLVTGGHLIDPAHHAVLDFVAGVLSPPG